MERRTPSWESSRSFISEELLLHRFGRADISKSSPIPGCPDLPRQTQGSLLSP